VCYIVGFYAQDYAKLKKEASKSQQDMSAKWEPPPDISIKSILMPRS
jgi:hypothetical protein